MWRLSYRADPAALPFADAHYNRQAIGSAQFVPPGRCLVLLANRALWVTSWQMAEYVKHAWGGAWINSLFRREGGPLASEMIREAVAVTRWRWGDAPQPHGLITFVDARHVKHKRDPGRCYLRAGFSRAGETKGGLLAFQMKPDEMPPAEAPIGAQEEMFPKGSR